MLTPSTKLSLSAYQKEYSDSPILPGATLHSDPTFLFDELRMYNGIVSSGTALSDGLEILIQKKKAENFYGLVGGSIFNSTFTDYDGIKRNKTTITAIFLMLWVDTGLIQIGDIHQMVIFWRKATTRSTLMHLYRQMNRYYI